MKIQNIIVACLTIVVLGAAFTSCQTAADPAKQAKVVDSLVQVKVDAQIAELNKECKENSMKMAMAMVDSITEANAKNVASKSSGKKSVAKPTPAVKPPTTIVKKVEEPVNAKKSKMQGKAQQAQEVVDNKKAKMKGESKKAEEVVKSKKDKMKGKF